MSNSFFDLSSKLFLVIFISLILLCCFLIPILYNNIDFNLTTLPVKQKEILSIYNSSNFIWPVPGFNKLSSKFGYRASPTEHASSNHLGIDVPAPAGTNILCVQDGLVISAKFSGSGGFTVVIKHNSMYTSIYCHVDPNFLVCVNQFVHKGQIIAKVGPKNVHNVPNNPYKDTYGIPTNGAITRSTSSFWYKRE